MTYRIKNNTRLDFSRFWGPILKQDRVYGINQLDKIGFKGLQRFDMVKIEIELSPQFMVWTTETKLKGDKDIITGRKVFSGKFESTEYDGLILNGPANAYFRNDIGEKVGQKRETAYKMDERYAELFDVFFSGFYWSSGPINPGKDIEKMFFKDNWYDKPFGNNLLEL